MKPTKSNLLSTTVVPAIAVAGIALGVASAPMPAAAAGYTGCSTAKQTTAELPAAKARGGYIQLAACAPSNPCAANPCNPCAAANPCNPCAAKNPCAAGNPCNPCAAKNPCNPCAAANPCNPCAAKKKY